MTLLTLGVLLWSAVHLLPIRGRAMRARLVERTGEDPYKGLFSLAIVASIVLMVLGWRSTTPSFVYAPPPWGRLAANGLMLLSLFLFVAAALPSRVKRWIRHPQLTCVVVWSCAHLLANGEQRSLVLFGGLGAWAIASMLLLNQRDGAWQKPAPGSWSVEAGLAIGTLAAFAGIYWAHPWIAGVSPTP